MVRATNSRTTTDIYLLWHTLVWQLHSVIPTLLLNLDANIASSISELWLSIDSLAKYMSWPTHTKHNPIWALHHCYILLDKHCFSINDVLPREGRVLLDSFVQNRRVVLPINWNVNSADWSFCPTLRQLYRTWDNFCFNLEENWHR